MIINCENLPTLLRIIILNVSLEQNVGFLKLSRCEICSNENINDDKTYNWANTNDFNIQTKT